MIVILDDMAYSIRGYCFFLPPRTV
jgi:hypothetical protein